MPIQPANVSVTDPISRAIEGTKQLLFRPFNLQRWFIIGFCAWLANLGQGGGSGFNGNFGSHHATGSFRDAFEHARTYVISNLTWIVPLAIVVVVLCLALGVVILWISSRGKFMFLHCVALDKTEIKEPWDRFVREGNSLFRFRLVVGLLTMIPAWPLLIVIGIAVYRMFERGAPSWHGIAVVLVAGLAFMAVCIAAAVLMKLTTDFVVPIMFLRRNRCLAAWKEFISLLAVNDGNFALYLLFQIVLSMAIGVLVLCAILVTCCVAGCVMAIPYLGAVLLLPVSTFKRSYSLHYLAQYGPEYNVFPPPVSAI